MDAAAQVNPSVATLVNSVSAQRQAPKSLFEGLTPWQMTQPDWQYGF